MAKVEITMSEDEKRTMQDAADGAKLRLATWARAQLLLAAIRAKNSE